MTDNHRAAIQLTADDIAPTLAEMFGEVAARNPDAVILLAKCGADLMLRVAGKPVSLVRLYADSQPEIERILREMVEVAAGLKNG